ncbi:MAG: IS110 family transposase [Candidatus Competibacteraceae bacterium]|nr:IS110 family transposase [Candidatus Competibacteraceae bacterium]
MAKLWKATASVRQRIEACDQRISDLMQQFPEHPHFKAQPTAQKSNKAKSPEVLELERLCGADLTRIPSINATTARVVLSEIGTDMSRFKTEKHLCSWLGLCPDHRISGGKVLKRKTRDVSNRAAHALRLAASSLLRSKSALGANFRRLRARIGAPKAITAMANKLARLIYRMLRFGLQYLEAGQQKYEEKFRQNQLKWLKKQAQALGMQVLPAEPVGQSVS